MTHAGNKLLATATLLLALFGQLICHAQDSKPKLRPITSYPTVDKIWLSLEDGHILAADQKIYVAPSECFITLLKPNGSKLKKGDLFAVIDQDLLDLEKRSLDLEQEKFDKKIKDIKSEQTATIRKQNEAIQALETKKLELTLSTNAHTLSKKLQDRIQVAVKEIDTQISEIKATIDPKTLEQELKMAEEELKINLDQKLRANDQLRRRSRLKAGFPGTLNLLIDKPNDEGNLNRPIWVELNKPFASIINDKQYEIRVSNRNPIFNNFPKERFIALIDDGGSRKLVQAAFEETRKVEINGVLRDQQIFKFPEESVEYAEQNIGETRTIFIYLKLKEEAYLVNKNDIALLAPEVLDKSGWRGLVKHLYPGHKVLHIGPKTLAVSK